MKLFPHQTKAVSWLLDHPRGGFFDDQGLGKTISALVAADMIGRRIVIVCPTVVLYNWAEECAAWTDRQVSVLDNGRAKIDEGATVVITTHGLLLREGIMAELEWFAPDVLIGDEVQMLRGRDGKKAKAFWGELVPPAEYVWALTGTPQPAWPSDMWTMLHHMWPDEFAEDFDTFRASYCLMAPSDYGEGLRTVGTLNLGNLRHRMDGKFLRRLKSVELNLPPLTHSMVTLKAKLPQEMMNLDGVLSEEAVEKIMAAESPEAAFAVLLDDTDMSSYRRRCGEAKVPIVAELVAMELGDPKAKRVLFCHHKSVAEALSKALAKFNPVLLTGAVSAKRRTDRVKKFQTDPSTRVAICQIIAGGTGVTLTASNDILFVEASFLPGDNAQARDRVYRIGQTRPCSVRFVALHGSADSIIMRVLRRKTAAIQGVFQ